jgi:hypothetical protein
MGYGRALHEHGGGAVKCVVQNLRDGPVAHQCSILRSSDFQVLAQVSSFHRGGESCDVFAHNVPFKRQQGVTKRWTHGLLRVIIPLNIILESAL